jgi:hypothetical protein
LATVDPSHEAIVSSAGQSTILTEITIERARENRGESLSRTAPLFPWCASATTARSANG